MRDLSIIQEYMLCVVNEKGKISGFSIEKLVCFVTAGVLELQMENCIAIDEKKARITGKLPVERQYLAPLYEFIAEKEPVKIKRIMEEYNLSLTDKRLDALLDAVGGSLVRLGFAKEGKSGLLGNKKCYIPDAEAIHRVIDMARAELFEEGEVSEETAALVILLERGKCLKSYFSRFEQKEMKKKLQEIVSSPEGQMVKEMVDHIESLLVIISVSAGSSV